MLMFVCVFGSNLSRAFNLHAIFMHSAVSQQSLSSQTYFCKFFGSLDVEICKCVSSCAILDQL